MNRMSLFKLLIVSCLALMIAAPVMAGEWLEDFERLCTRIEDAEDMSTEELEGLVGECGALLNTIGASDNPKKKMYIFRLKKCKNFYQYNIDLKEVEGTDAGPGTASETAPPE